MRMVTESTGVSGLEQAAVSLSSARRPLGPAGTLTSAQRVGASQQCHRYLALLSMPSPTLPGREARDRAVRASWGKQEPRLPSSFGHLCLQFHGGVGCREHLGPWCPGSSDIIHHSSPRFLCDAIGPCPGLGIHQSLTLLPKPCLVPFAVSCAPSPPSTCSKLVMPLPKLGSCSLTEKPPGNLCPRLFFFSLPGLEAVSSPVSGAPTAFSQAPFVLPQVHCRGGCSLWGQVRAHPQSNLDH